MKNILAILVFILCLGASDAKASETYDLKHFWTSTSSEKFQACEASKARVTYEALKDCDMQFGRPGLPRVTECLCSLNREGATCKTGAKLACRVPEARFGIFSNTYLLKHYATAKGENACEVAKARSLASAHADCVNSFGDEEGTHFTKCYCEGGKCKVGTQMSCQVGKRAGHRY